MSVPVLHQMVVMLVPGSMQMLELLVFVFQFVGSVLHQMVGTCVIPEACVVGTCVAPDGCVVPGTFVVLHQMVVMLVPVSKLVLLESVLHQMVVMLVPVSMQMLESLVSELQFVVVMMVPVSLLVCRNLCCTRC